MLQTDHNGRIPVHLGPIWYILRQNMKFEPKDKRLKVKGCRVLINGTIVVMASWVGRADEWLESKDEYVYWEHLKGYELRDKDGVPFWCAWQDRFK